MQNDNTPTKTVENLPHSGTSKISVQVRSANGQIIDSVNDVEDITEAIGVKIRFEKTYSKNWYMISIHFINK